MVMCGFPGMLLFSGCFILVIADDSAVVVMWDHRMGNEEGGSDSQDTNEEQAGKHAAKIKKRLNFVSYQEKGVSRIALRSQGLHIDDLVKILNQLFFMGDKEDGDLLF